MSRSVSRVVDRSNYREIAADCIQKARDIGINLDGWKFSSETKGVKIYRRKVEGSSITQVRGDITGVRCNLKALAKFIVGVTNIHISDGMAIRDHCSVVQTFEKGRFIVHASFKLPWPLWNRDFMWYEIAHIDPEDNIGILFAVGCVHQDWPDQKGFVRGSIHESGYIITPVSDTECNLTYVVQADPCGYIPVWLVNALADDQALNVSRIKEYFEHYPNERAAEDVSDLEESHSEAERKSKKKKRKGKKDRVVASEEGEECK